MTKYEILYRYSAEISQQPRGWAADEGAIGTKVNLIQQIQALELPQSILLLSSFLQSTNNVVRAQANESITFLFSKITLKHNIYDSLKYFNIKNDDFEVFKTNFSSAEYTTILKIATFNYDGYVREQALRELIAQGDASAIPFIIFRLGDWVAQIRKLAKQGILEFNKTEFLPQLTLSVPYFDWLKSVQRTNLTALSDEIMTFIITENYDDFIQNFYNFDTKTRLILAKYIIAKNNISEREIQIFLNDKYCVIRQLLLKQFSKLPNSAVNQLLNDKTMFIRLNTLYKLSAQKADLQDWAMAHLADNYASIRNLARYELKNSGINFIEFYAEKIKQNEQIIGAIGGLAELNGKMYTDCITPFAVSENRKLRKAAQLALIKLENFAC